MLARPQEEAASNSTDGQRPVKVTGYLGPMGYSAGMCSFMFLGLVFLLLSFSFLLHIFLVALMSATR